jgi:hypothetical protein
MDPGHPGGVLSSLQATIPFASALAPPKGVNKKASVMLPSLFSVKTNAQTMRR